MPELPEVETTRRGVEPHAVGHKIVALQLYEPRLRWRVPDELPDLVAGQRILHAKRRAKYLLLELESGTLLLHLGMSGSLRVLPADTPRLTHDHFDLILDSGITLRFNDPRRFGSLHYVTGDPNEHPLLAKLAPEPLDPAFSADYLWRITRRRRVAIKQLLMNSRLVVGVGNIYANEALFRAKVRPRRQARTLNACRDRANRSCSEVRPCDGDSCWWHDSARLCWRGRPAGLFQTEALRVRTQCTALSDLPHPGPSADPGTAFHLLLSDLSEVSRTRRRSLPIRTAHPPHVRR